MSRRCPRCRTEYAGEARFCPKDGSPLIEVSSPTAARRAAPPGETTETTARQSTRRGEGPSKGRAAALQGEMLDGRYQVVRRLGEGGMAYVYEARDTASSDTVAIKVLTPKLSRDRNSVERLRREAGLAMRLDHPNVCRISRLGETEDGLIYLVMPYLAGDMLSDREVRVGPMPPDEGLEILVQVCAGLHHAHQFNIVHRDLKPENIMLVKGPDGRDKAVVMDFGLAKERRADPSVAKLTATGIILGTPEFMSPEQIRGKPLDGRSDVYAVGVLAYEMFTGKLPFLGDSPQEMMIARLRGRPIPIWKVRPQFPPALAQVLMRCLETNPTDRHPTALDLGHALVDTVRGTEQERLRRFLS